MLRWLLASYALWIALVALGAVFGQELQEALPPNPGVTVHDYLFSVLYPIGHPFYYGALCGVAYAFRKYYRAAALLLIPVMAPIAFIGIVITRNGGSYGLANGAVLAVYALLVPRPPISKRSRDTEMGR